MEFNWIEDEKGMYEERFALQTANRKGNCREYSNKVRIRMKRAGGIGGLGKRLAEDTINPVKAKSSKAI